MGIAVRSVGLWLALALTLSLAACSLKPDPQEDAIARKVYADLEAGNEQAVADVSTPQIRAELHDNFAKIRTAVPPGARWSNDTAVNWSSTEVAGGPRNTTILHEYIYPDRVVQATTYIQTLPGKRPLVTGMNVRGWMKADIGDNRLTLEGKGWQHYVVAGAGASILLLILAALVKLVFEPRVKRRWLWGLFIILGFTQFAFNWTTGQWNFQPLFFSLFGVGVLKQGAALAPWVVRLAFPLGAVIFLLRRRVPPPREPAAP